MNTVQDKKIETRNIYRFPGRPIGGGGGSTNCVWLVDDNEEIRDLLAALLGTVRGVECSRGFSSPSSLLAALRREPPPDTVLMDFGSPEQNAVDYIQLIKSVNPAIRVLMLATFYDSERAARAFGEGASGFLVKRDPIQNIVEQIFRARLEAEPG